MAQIKFYTDVHISHEAVRQLQKKGVEIIHCGDVGMSDAGDEEHLMYAVEHGYVMVTCDQGFERYHTEYQQAGREHTGIVYFQMDPKCKSIGTIVNEILFLHEAADYRIDLYNKVWRV